MDSQALAQNINYVLNPGDNFYKEYDKEVIQDLVRLKDKSIASAFYWT